MDICIKRIYEPPSEVDGKRILVDRLWPRGVSKSSAKVDLWLRDIAPSSELRKWFGHEVSKWNEFRKRYRNELAEKKDIIEKMLAEIGDRKITLLYAAKDEKHNNAQVLREFIIDLLKDR